MNWLLGKIVGNPAVLLAIVLAAFLAGGSTAWTVQGWRLDAVQSRFDGFVAAVKAKGEAAQKLKLAQEKQDKLNKERTDAEVKDNLDRLRADNKRLRNARASVRAVPDTASAPGDPDRACFDRTQLESAVQLLDSEVSGLVEQGSEAVVKLNAAKDWALRRADTLTPH